MMGKNNRFMASALGLLLCVGLLCGCGNQSGSGTPSSESGSDVGGDQTASDHKHTYNDGICSCGARKPSEGLIYELEDDQENYILVGIGQCTDAEIVVPATYNGKPVSGIRIEEDNNSTITSVYICEGVAYIDWMIGLKNLRYVYVPESVTVIGDMTSLENLEQVDGCEGLEIIREGFRDCKSLKSIRLPDNMVEIGSAFVRCNSLTSFRFPAGAEYISSGFLSECENLSEVIIPDTVTSIPSRAFSKCPKLTSITIPASVTTLGQDVFFKSGIKDIYCEAPSQPSGWDPNWANGCDATIHWGSTENP